MAHDVNSSNTTEPPRPEDAVRTTRLRLREFVDADAPFIVDLLNDAAFLQFIGDRHVRTRDDAEAYIRNGPKAMYASHGFGLLHVALRDSDIPIGMCGILKRDALEHPDIGFAFLPAFRRQGYAREAVEAVVARAWEVHGLERLAAIVDPANAASLALLARMGFTVERAITMPGGDKELLLLGLDRPGDVRRG